MKARGGYLILENIISIMITGIIASTLYGVLFFSINIYEKIHSTVEIQQQGMEIQKYIEKELHEGVELKSVKTTNNQTINSITFETKDVTSIKYKPIDRPDTQGLDEITLNNISSKVFIKRKNATSGYEIGDYIDHIYISRLEKGKLIDIKLELSKNDQKHEIEFSLYNNGGGDI